MTISIHASVGLHGDNEPDDVLVVKSRLLELGFPFVTADSVMGPLTIKAIRLFQAVKNGLNDVDDQRNDGRVDVNGDTFNTAVYLARAGVAVVTYLWQPVQAPCSPATAAA